MTKEKKKILTNNVTCYLSMLGTLSMCLDSSTPLLRARKPVGLLPIQSFSSFFKELDVEVKHVGSLPMHMCTLGCEKKLITKISILAIRALKKENAT